MSVPNMTNNIIQPQNIVLNQAPLSHHAVMTNINPSNGIPMATGLNNVPTTIDQVTDMKSGHLMESMPMVASNMVGIPATVPVQNISPVKTAPVFQGTGNIVQESFAVISKARLNELTRNTDPSLTLEDDVEECLMAYTEHLIEKILKGASSIAKHRHVNSIEVKDVQLYLTKNFGIWAPGFGTDELKPYKRSLTAESHKQRLALIRKALKKY